jgi:nucleoside-triphosphatase
MPLLLTGAPGVGKTTVIRAAVASLSGRRLNGFYTEEMRKGGVRLGFRLVTFDGRSAVIAHVDERSGPRVGKYGVDVAAIDLFARSALTAPADVYFVDEIGKMECLSDTFVEATRQLLDSGRTVVATVGQRGSGFIAEVKRRADSELWEVTRANRDTIAGKVIGWLDSVS